MISLLVPSRGRPELLRRMITSAKSCGAGMHEILVRLDSDDSTFRKYDRHSVNVLKTGMTASVGVCWNELARLAKGDWLMMGNDDLVFMSENWDCALKNRLESAWDDKIFVAWCNDGSNKASKRCAFPIVSRKWYETLGYFAPECFHFLWHDTWVWDIGVKLDRLLHIPDILIEHRHFAFKKAVYDDTYRRHREGAEQQLNRKADADTYKQLAHERHAAAVKLRMFMND